MIKILIKLLVLTIFFFLHNGSFAQERVSNSTKSFSIIPSKNWENHSKGTSLVFVQPKENNLDIFQENISFKEYPANGKNLEELWNAYVINDLPKLFNSYKVKQVWKSNIKGKKANWIECSNVYNGIKFRNLIYMLVEQDTLYFIICIATDNRYQKTENEFRKMINSFKIKR